MGADDSGAFVKVGLSDVEVGKPLLHPLYDGNRKLLLKRGYVIENTRQCEMLLERGLYRNTHERSSHHASSSLKQEEEPQSKETITVLEKTKIRIGEVLHMQSTPDAPRLQVRLIGYMKGKGLMVSVPETILLKEGQTFIVRFFSGKHAYAFTTTVSKQTSVPFHHVHLAYPREVRGLEIRKGSRIDVELIAAVSYSINDEQKSGSGKIVNISTGGGGLRAKSEIGEKGGKLLLKFKVQVDETISMVSINCNVRSITKDDGDASMPFLHGLQFEDPDPQTSMIITAFVYQKIVDELQ